MTNTITQNNTSQEANQERPQFAVEVVSVLRPSRQKGSEFSKLVYRVQVKFGEEVEPRIQYGYEKMQGHYLLIEAGLVNCYPWQQPSPHIIGIAHSSQEAYSRLRKSARRISIDITERLLEIRGEKA